MVWNILTAFFGVVISLFIFWKRLKEDYSSEIIFSSGIVIYIFLFAGYFLTKKLFPSWFFWGSFLSLLLGLGIVIWKYKVRFYESFEAITFSLLPFYSFIFLKDSVINSSLISFIAFLVCLTFIYIFFYFDTHYKEFSWYKSGKIGFSGLATLGIFFLTRAAIAIFFHSVLSFVEVYEPYISGISAFFVSLLIFNLGRLEK